MASVTDRKADVNQEYRENKNGKLREGGGRGEERDYL
jgi:hypothetical protein